MKPPGVSSLAEHEYMQMHFHIYEVLTLDTQYYVVCADAIEVPLLFVNGEWDEYTSVEDACLFAGHARQSQFHIIKNAGHFLDMEHQTAWHDTQQALLGFLQPASSLVKPKSAPPLGSRHRYAASDRIFSHHAAHFTCPVRGAWLWVDSSHGSLARLGTRLFCLALWRYDDGVWPTRKKPAAGALPVPTSFVKAERSATLGLRGRNLFPTLRTLALQGIKQPIHSARHALAFGGNWAVCCSAIHRPPSRPGCTPPRPILAPHPLYRRSLQAYRAWQKQLNAWVDESNLAAGDQARARFILAQLGDALSPSNNPLNPLAVKELFNTGGASLLKGIGHLIDDLRHNSGMPRQVSKLAFEVGRNIATTPGAVVFRNELLELIQYQPMSEKQYARPLLIVPPQINKYYIFDLSAEKSFVQYALKNGLQVFIVSWRNPDARHREWGLPSYVHHQKKPSI